MLSAKGDKRPSSNETGGFSSFEISGVLSKLKNKKEY